MTTHTLSCRPTSIRAGTALLWGFLLLSPAGVHAANGDCSQPVSNGAAPVATDCLYILNVAVGLQTCSPACICAPSGTLPSKATDALLCLNASVGVPVALDCPCEPVITDGDDFNDNDKDKSRWGAAVIDGNGLLTEKNQRLEYTCSAGTADDSADWPWLPTALPVDSNWEMQIDLVNLTVPSASDEVNSFGIGVVSAQNVDSEVYAELYASSLGRPPARNGFYAELLTNGSYIGDADSGGLGITVGAVRMLFDSSSKVIVVSYDSDPSNGYQWTTYGTFGVAGFGGSNGNTDWGLSDSDVLYAYVYGFSAEMKIAAGKMYGDNFQQTGGIPTP